MLTLPGAVAAGGLDSGVAAHYGDPMREQRRLAAGRAVVDLSHLGVVEVTGPDRLGWLDTLSSQRVRDLVPGASAELLLLDPHGHVAHAAALIDDGVRALLVTEAGAAPALASFLDSMRFMLAVEVAVRHDVVIIGAVAAGGLALEALEAASGGMRLATWRDPWPGVSPGGTRYSTTEAEHPGHETPFALVLVRANGPDVLHDVVQHVLATPAGGAEHVGAAGIWAWEALRVAAWRPRYGREVDERTLPHELDWLRTAVHLEKGCYRGQESVARIVNLGRPPRRLVLLHLDGSEHIVPEAGAAVLHGDRGVGRLTSVVRHHESGPLALAVVKRALAIDAPLLVGGIAASQEMIVDPRGEAEARPEQRGPLMPGLRRRAD